MMKEVLPKETCKEVWKEDLEEEQTTEGDSLWQSPSGSLTPMAALEKKFRVTV